MAVKNYKYALVSGKLSKIPSSQKSKYSIPDPSHFFSPVTNLIPGLSSVSGARVLIGDKSSLQAMTLVNREAPLVQAAPKGEDSESFADQFGKHVSLRASSAGTVSKVDDTTITIKDADGKEHHHDKYSNYMVGRDSYIHHTPVVKVGDAVKKGGLLATSNFSDSKGTLAIGMNLKTAIMPFRSLNFEDSLAISETAAKKLEGEQLIPVRMEIDRGVLTDKDRYISLFPNKYYNDQLTHMDASGVVKKGTVLKHGDPVILAFQPKSLKSLDIQLGKLAKVIRNAYSDVTAVWEYEYDGEVTDVSHTGKLIAVTVKTRRPMSFADKLNMPFGAKGVVHIVPDTQMPQGEDGKPVDVLLNSMSITSRVAPGLVNAIGLAKLAEKQGKPIKLTGFTGGSAVQHVIDKLAEHGIKDTEKLYDPQSGKHIDVLTGPLYFNRLHHIAEDKISARSSGTTYDINCYDKQTEVLTARGWLYWEDVVSTDLFLTDIGGKLSFEPAKQLYKYLYTGEMQGYRSKYLDWLVTPNHRMYVANHWKSKKEKEQGSRDMFFSEMSGVYGEKFYVKQTGGKLDRPDAPETVAVGNKTFAADDYAEFLGWYLAEGSLNLDEKRHSYKICIWQSQDANPEKFERIRQLLTRMGLAFWLHTSDTQGVVGFVFSDKVFLEHLLDSCGGRYCEEKEIPAQVLETFSLCSLTLMAEALIAGDGHSSAHVKNSTERKKPNIITGYSSTSKKLADSVQSLFILLGHTGLVHKYTYKANPHKLADGCSIRSDATCELYRVSLSKDRAYALVLTHRDSSYFYTEAYDDFVYCAEIPASGLLYVRRNGKPMLCGNCQPSKAGSHEKAKRIGNLATTVALSNDAKAVLRDIATVRATKNDDFWTALKLGHAPPPPKVPFIFNKFISHLKGAGVNVQEDGSKFHIIPQTDRDIVAMSSGEIKEPLGYKLKNDTLIEEDGGLFDPTLTGIHGDNYNHIILHHNIPNPLSEEPIRKMLKMTKVKYDDSIASGKLEKELKSINVDEKIAELKQFVASKKRSGRDDAVKALSFMTMLKQNNLKPADMMLSKVPIIPAQYRPVMAQGNQVLTADINELYKDLMLVNRSLGQVKDHSDIDPAHVHAARQQLYNGVKAVYGLGEPVSQKSVEKGYKGLLATALGLQGGSAKGSMFQAKVVNKPIDLVGRAVLLPDSKLEMNQAGIPQQVAWNIYSPFIIRRLVRMGIPATKAREYLDNKHPLALSAMHEEMADRPGIVTRDPQLSKYNFQGMYLKMNPDPKDFSIRLNPLTFKGFSADSDGDQLNVQLPATDEAKEEIKEKLLPEKNLIYHRTFSPMYTPSNEAATGLFAASYEENKIAPKKYNSEQDIVRDFIAGKLDIGDRVEI